MIPSDFKPICRAKPRQSRAPICGKGSLKSFLEPYKHSSSSVKRVQSAPPSSSKPTKIASVTVLLIVGSQNGEEYVRVIFCVRSVLDGSKAYVKLTEREKGLAVSIFNAALVNGTGVNEAVRTIKLLHPIYKNVGKASLARWSVKAAAAGAPTEASETVDSRKRGRPRIVADAHRKLIQKQV
jgi:hypothetical protein